MTWFVTVKKIQPLSGVKHSDVIQCIHTYKHIYIHVHIYTYIHTYMSFLFCFIWFLSSSFNLALQLEIIHGVWNVTISSAFYLRCICVCVCVVLQSSGSLCPPIRSQTMRNTPFQHVYQSALRTGNRATCTEGIASVARVSVSSQSPTPWGNRLSNLHTLTQNPMTPADSGQSLCPHPLWTGFS